ncbi:methyl-accepting chemotaxis protein [Magnetovibrio sp. PR-2]|uniref:methyl-accepting chemotaxis protein n=1 Tax=Magnetovibrio sp. PR-2 TaxID=3120356 RepID=UPI002FCE5154
MVDLTTIKSKAIIATATILSGVVILSAASILILNGVASGFSEVSKTTHRATETLVPLQILIKDINADVIQVQQWLTDISATRGLPGFDDGFAEAENFAQKFQEDLNNARQLAQELNAADVMSKLDALEASFAPFYAGGKRMAQAYIDEGPKGGNIMMEEFDTFAAQMGESLEGVNEAINTMRTMESERLTHLVDDWLATSNNTVLLLTGFCFVGLVIIGFISAKMISVANVILRVSDGLSIAASGDLDHRLTHIRGRDEAAKMQRNLNSLLDRTEAFNREVGAAMDAAATGRYNRCIVRAGMVRDFERSCDQVNQSLRVMSEKITGFGGVTDSFENQIHMTFNNVKSGAGKIETIAESMSQNLDSSGNRSLEVTETATEAKQTVEMVLVAAEELSSSIQEISSQITKSTQITHKAVDNAKDANDKIRALAEASTEIKDVVSLINDIAEQTNLLALNATIEAARAGEHGKGFAVVATEVKNLAGQVAKATEEIARQVGDIQTGSSSAVEAIETISSTIGTVNEITGSVATAVEEQTAATDKIAQNVESVSSSMDLLSDSIGRVSRQRIASYGAGIKVLWAAKDIHPTIEQLDAETKTYLDTARSI